MKKFLAALCFPALLSACVSLTVEEKMQLKELKAMGITLDNPGEGFTPPASRWKAGLLNFPFSLGDVYLGVGDAAEPELKTVAYNNVFVTLPLPILEYIPLPILWPISWIWSVPQGISDAGTINKRALVAYYYNTAEGRLLLDSLNDPTASHKPRPTWVGSFQKSKSGYVYFVGKGRGPTAKEALTAAYNDARDDAAREKCGVEVEIRTTERSDEKGDSVSVSSTEKALCRLEGFEKIDDYVMSKNGEYHGAVYYRIPKAK